MPIPNATSLFVSNRQRLMEKLQGGAIVISAYTSMQRSNDVATMFEQEANFWWLCGIESPDWWLIMDGLRGKAWLVEPAMTKARETFDGGLDSAQARTISGVDGILSHEEGLSLLRDLAKKHSVVYTLGNQARVQYLNFHLNPAPKKMYDMLDRTFNGVRDCRKELARLRAIKQPEEIARLKKAINLTVQAFEEVKVLLPAMTYEYEVEAEFTYHFRKNGAQDNAFEPIVASGKNACTLHYAGSNAKLKKHELVLLDIGARMNGYATDIARTYAIGEPTKRQQQVHAAVQASQRQIISMIKPGVLIEQYQRDADDIMKETLLQLELLRDKNDHETYRHYFPHAVGHGIGVDAHDNLGESRIFEPGMVLTVEPGIYIPEERIGVRIEDDILVTPNRHTNLSARLSTDL